MDQPRVRIDAWRGQAAVLLSAGAMEATLLPAMGMLGVSLRVDGTEYLDMAGGVRAARRGAEVGFPFLHPWANRLSAFAYRVGDTAVELADVDGELSTDTAGLPLHGTMAGAVVWEPVAVGTTAAAASFAARFRYDQTAGSRFDAFPFPHDVVVTATVDGALSVHTQVRATGSVAVPVSFGWHPWFRFPGARRSQLRVQLPAHQRIELDSRMIPTGRAEPHPGGDIGLADGDLDAHVVLGGPTMAVRSRDRRVVVRVDEGYPFAQVFSPADRPVVCLEPMVARIDALVAGTAPIVEPNGSYEAHLSVSVDSV